MDLTVILKPKTNFKKPVKTTINCIFVKRSVFFGHLVKPEKSPKMTRKPKKHKENVKKSKTQSCCTSSGTKDKLPPKYQDRIRKKKGGPPL